MKILLQDIKTSKFMRCDSMWTMDINEALNFLSVQRATLFGMRELGDPFQVLQIQPDGFSSPVTTIIAQQQWPKIQVLAGETVTFKKQITLQNLPSQPLAGDWRTSSLLTPKKFPAVRGDISAKNEGNASSRVCFWS